jgi:hypothetical protein
LQMDVGAPSNPSPASHLVEARARTWGKRDAWVWLLAGPGVVVSLLNAIDAIERGGTLAGLGYAIIVGVLASYLLLLPFSRKALLMVGPLWSAVGVIASRDQPPSPVQTVLAWLAIAGGLAWTACAVVAYRSTRNKLAFKLEVSDRELAEYYDRYVRDAGLQTLGYGIASVLIPALVPVALIFGFRALRRVEPSVLPSVRRRRCAIAGLICVALSVMMWGQWFASAGRPVGKVARIEPYQVQTSP